MHFVMNIIFKSCSKRFHSQAIFLLKNYTCQQHHYAKDTNLNDIPYKLSCSIKADISTAEMSKTGHLMLKTLQLKHSGPEEKKKKCKFDFDLYCHFNCEVIRTNSRFQREIMNISYLNLIVGLNELLKTHLLL